MMASLEQGFAIIKNCLSQPECDSIAAHVESLTGAGTRCLLDSEWCQVLAISLKSRVAASITEIGSLVAVQCTYFNKSTTHNWFVAFHQDRSIPVGSTVSAVDWPGWSRKEGVTFVHGPDELLAQMIALRLHLDDSTPDNGPLRVIPGSHRTGTLTAQDVDAIRNSSTDELLAVGKGDIVAIRPLLLHASSRSRTMDNRRVLHFLFGPAALPPGLEWRRTV